MVALFNKFHKLYSIVFSGLPMRESITVVSVDVTYLGINTVTAGISMQLMIFFGRATAMFVA